MKIATWVAFGLSGLGMSLGSGMSWAQAPAQMGPHSVAEKYLFDEANQERQQRGLGTLQWNDTLYRAANNHCREMASRESISHQYPGEAELSARGRLVGARFSVISENVAQAPTAAWIHNAWMHSEGHRRNLLDPEVDSVAIRVLARNGELYAVEDFDRSVQQLSYNDQEQMVGQLLSTSSTVQILPSSDAARRTCTMDTGYAGARQPWFVMRYTAGDLTRLPDALKTKLATGKYHQAEVGACAAGNAQNFTAFNIAVLLYP
jgi:hypothetical protein